MKKFIIMLLGVMFSWHVAYSQNIVQTWTENFDGTVAFSSIPANAWKTNSTYFMSAPYSYRGVMPNLPGDSIILTTPVYDFRTNAYPFVQLRFNHICKVSPKDSIFIEYRITSSVWKRIPANAYKGGAAANYRMSGGFNAASYQEWQVGDSTVFPTQSWWKEEVFDLSDYVDGEMTEFRFIIKHGNRPGTQLSYGWLLDNFEVTAATYELKPPVVEFRSPFVKDTVYSTGPWDINAKVVTRTAARIERPWLKYMATLNGVLVGNDSVLMTNVGGDSLWKAAIPQFVAGTDVAYSITGRDTIGNYSMIQSAYHIKKLTIAGDGYKGWVYAGDTNSTSTNTYVPYYVGYGYGWSQELILASEINPLTVGGIISSASYFPTTYTHTDAMTNQSLFFKAVPASFNSITAIPTYVDPFTDGATLVWSGAVPILTANTWYDITLTTPFFLPPGYNLLVYWENRHGHFAGSSVWKSTSFSPTMSAYRYQDGSFPINSSTGSGMPAARTNMRFHVTNNPDLGQSVAIHSIDMNDTLTVAPGLQLPIVATIKNKGNSNLTSAIIYYSINGGTPQQYNWTGNLPWDFNSTNTIGYYYPVVNKLDTFVVWVESPNGAVDTITWDDTLTKNIYSSSDIVAALIAAPTDTVYTTGRYILKARIKSLTGSLPPISLYVASTYQGVTSYDTLPMILDMSDTLWKVSIPHYRFETDVAYSITLRDILGNDIVLSGGYHIKRVGCTTASGGAVLASEYFYTGDEQTVMLPPGLYEIETWGADGAEGSFYSGVVLPEQILGGKGGYSVGRITLTSATTLNIVVGGKGTNNGAGSSPGGYNGGGNSSSAIYIAGAGGGATHIATAPGILSSLNGNRTAVLIVAGGGGGGGNQSIGGHGGGLTGVQPATNTQFTNRTAGGGGTQSAGGVCYTDGSGAGFGQGGTTSQNLAGGGGGGWYGGCSGDNSTGGGGGSGYVGDLTDEITADASQGDFIVNPDITGNGYVRITPIAVSNDTGVCLDNSVAITAINSPMAARTGNVTAGILTPVQVTIRNRGVADLDSCLINWSLNGVTQLGTTIYRGQLTEDFSDTITIGSYIPIAGIYDTIRVWVSMPNGEVDSVTYDDTLRVTTRTCNAGGMSGDFVVGASVSADYPTLDAAFKMLKECGVTSAVRFLLENGTYIGNISIAAIANYMNAGSSFELTSVSGNAQDVIIQSTGVGITLANNRNITIKDLTIDVTSGTYGVNFIAACTNILIRDCRILTDTATTASTTAPIYKASATGIADSIFIINNFLDGGYYGIYFYGGTSTTAYGTHVVFDSNTVNNSYYYGTYFYYTDFISRSYNTMLSRTANTSTYWYGLQNYYTNGPIIGNRIIQRSNAITYPYGIYSYYYNNNFPSPNPDTALVSNNEIILNTTGVYYGMALYSAQAKVLHNSIYVSGSGSARGIYLQNVTTDKITLKNNNICMLSPAAHPIYLNGVTNISQYDIDYNNMYAPTYVGYAGANVASMTTWQQLVPTDRHSVRVLPDFVNPTTNLEMINNIGLLCNQAPLVSEDITLMQRTTPTTMGCYETPSVNGDGMLVKITGLSPSISSGQSDNVKVIVYNGGLTPLTFVNIGWSVNGTIQQAASTYPVSLTQGQSDTITIGQITYPFGLVTIEVWLNTLNQGSLLDEYLANDTVSMAVFGCSGNLSGQYTIGNTGNFPSVASVLEAIANCGVNGDITLAFLPGTYNTNIDLRNSASLLGNYKLMLTSTTNDAQDVIIRYSGVGIILGNSRNIILKALTIDVTSGTYGIQFMNACTNILIRDCRILADTTTTSSTTAPIYKGSGTGIVDSIFIINNLLDGGYYGFYFYAGTGTGLGQYGTHLIFDSNTVSNQYYYATYPFYADFISCSYNTVLSRTVNTTTTWYALRLYYGNGPAVGNRIIQRSNAITSPYGLYTYYHNYYLTTDTALIANNEMILNANSTGYGIYAYYTHSKILHNSIYMTGDGTATGIYISNSAYNVMHIKNNNIVVTASTAYPIYFSATGNLNLYDIDYNNLYAPKYVGYYDAPITNMTAWQTLIPTDLNSVQILPYFSDPATSLELIHNIGLTVPAIASVTEDIQLTQRLLSTTLGCYEVLFMTGNGKLAKITGLPVGAITGTMDDVKVVLLNTGTTPLTSVSLGWSINGIIQNAAITYPVSLAYGASDTITVGQITYPSADAEIMVWLNELNGGMLQDALLTDDTARITVNNCSVIYSGLFNIGATGDFPSVTAFFDAVRFCGVNGDIILAFQTDTHRVNVDLSNNAALFGNYKLTLTSSTGNAHDVIIRPTSGVGITLYNSRNIEIRDITVDAKAANNNAVQFTGACTNIVIRDCRLLADTTTTASTSNPLYKGSGTGIADSIFIINNLLEGGYYGTCFYDGTGTGVGQYGTNVVFDSNTLHNNYYYATYFTYVDFISCSYNSFLSRRANTSSYWYGLYRYYSNGPAIGNRIIQRSTAITYPYGMYLYYNNYYPTPNVDTALIANNEIILNTSSTYYGMYIYNCHAKIINNSIYISGSGAARGIYISNSTENNLLIKNNNIVLASANAHPIYFSAIGNLNLYDIDYNNLYASQFAGYYGANRDLTAWRQQTNGDLHSVQVLPVFINAPTSSLEMTNSIGLLSPVIDPVVQDIVLIPRLGNATMGCYEATPMTGNGFLSGFSGLPLGGITGQTDNVNLVVVNTGTTPLTSVDIGWSIDGIIQDAGTAYPVSLARGQSTTIALGQVTYPANDVIITAWINELNGGTLTDEYAGDDTLNITVANCPGLYSGLLTIGATGDFPSPQAALNAIRLCGINGDITLAFQSDTHRVNVDLSNNAALFGNYKLTLTSITGNATDVIIRPTSGIGITLSNSRNIEIRDLTVDAKVANNNAVQFIGACTNIVIRDCRLLADTTATGTTSNPLYKGSGTGIVDSIFIINNLLEGGYYGVYFYAGTGTGQYGNHLVFDSNTLQNNYYYACMLYYTDFISCSYNSCLSRRVNVSAYWYGLYRMYSNGPSIGNRILQRSTAITYPYGMYLYYNNYYPTPNVDTALIANNEIILYTTGTYYGMYIYYCQAKIINNSIYMAGTGAARGMSINNVMGDILSIKNNNIVMLSPEAYPIYMSGTTYLSQYDIDYNNMYASVYTAYAGTTVPSIAVWQQMVSTDQHSVQALPVFVNPATNLELSHPDYRLDCPLNTVTTDINGQTRSAINTMGAYYHAPIVGQDLTLLNIASWEKEVIEHQRVNVDVSVFNTGSVPITNAIFGWSLNGMLQTPVTWTASPLLNFMEQRTVTIGDFTVNAIDSVYKVVVWVNTINGIADSIQWNDTVSASVPKVLVAEFVAPFVDDTTLSLSFTVNTLIRTKTGAPTYPPTMTIQSKVNKDTILYDTIPMTLNNGIWQAAIPPQYYSSNVVYSLTVSDTVGNSITLTDSVYIRYVPSTGDSIRIVGTGTATTVYSPYYSNYDRGWSRAIYMDWELHTQEQGGYISEIAYFNTSASSSTVDSLSMYFRAASDSIITVAAYQDPIANGATLVWGQATNISNSGWNVFTLHKPFYLPPGANLMIYWNNRDGSYIGNGTVPYWEYTVALNKNIRSYADATPFPTTANILIDGNRPNARFTFASSSGRYNGYDLGLLALTEPVNTTGNNCSADYASIKIAMANLGTNDYDFSTNNVMLSVEVGGAIVFTTSKALTTGLLKSGGIDTIEITNSFPIYTSGQYDIKIWLTSPVDNVIYDDTLTASYISEHIGLPIDVDFSTGIPVTEFVTEGINSFHKWEAITQGIGADTIVQPVFGIGMLAFNGSRGAMTSFATRQMDLSRTIQPALSFWYFHDTIPSEDYMDVRITVDGGTTYTTLYSLTKYDAVYGWRQYSADLPPFAVNQCVFLVFEAMEKSNGDVTQYIDRIRITAKQDIAVGAIITPELTGCDLQNKELKVVISNLSDPVLNYVTTPITLTLEIKETGQIFNYPLTSGTLNSFTSDTLTMGTGFNFTKDTYTFKAYFTSVLDVDQLNDTLVKTVVVNPELAVRIRPESGGTTNCVPGDVVTNPTIVITNTGNLPLSDIGLKLYVHVGTEDIDSVFDSHPINNFMPGDSIVHVLAGGYTVPWVQQFYGLRTEVYLQCNAALVHAETFISECMDANDLALDSILTPSGNEVDMAGSQVNITVLLNNRSFVFDYPDVNITALITDSKSNTTALWQERIPLIRLTSDTTYTFTMPYTVPDDSIYTLNVFFTNPLDNYTKDDTVKAVRTTDYVGIKNREKNVISMSQNIPNPSNGTTRIDYSLPTDGEVSFHVYTISGQELFNQVVETTSGKHSIELNTTSLASGIYFYSMEFKGQRIVKRMSVSM